jgi:hypothetical protein
MKEVGRDSTPPPPLEENVYWSDEELLDLNEEIPAALEGLTTSAQNPCPAEILSEQNVKQNVVAEDPLSLDQARLEEFQRSLANYITRDEVEELINNKILEILTQQNTGKEETFVLSKRSIANNNNDKSKPPRKRANIPIKELEIRY